MSKILLVSILLSAFALPALAVELHEATVEYEHDGVACEGYVVHSKDDKSKRPLVLIFHQWKGLSDYEKQARGNWRKWAMWLFALTCMAAVFGPRLRRTPRKRPANTKATANCCAVVPTLR